MHLRTVIQLLVITLITAEKLYVSNLVKPRIANGEDTKPGGNKAVKIMKDDKLVCSGCLLGDRHVLTAATCIQNSNYKNFYVVKSYNTGYSLYKWERNYVRTAIIHPDYERKEFIADIAVLGVWNRIVSSIGIPITLPLCSVTLKMYDNVNVYGYGSDGYMFPYIQQYMSVWIFSMFECSEKFGRKLPSNVICAGNCMGSTLCRGDLGAPLVYNGEVCGIGIASAGCGNTRYPDIYTSVLYYRDFIKDAMQEVDYHFDRSLRRVHRKNGKFSGHSRKTKKL